MQPATTIWSKKCEKNKFWPKKYFFPFSKLDDECDGFGIQMVKLQDPVLAKRYGIKTFPSLVYFRNGNPLTFDGKHIFIGHKLTEIYDKYRT